MALTDRLRTEHDERGYYTNHDWTKEDMQNRWFSCLLQLHF
jgi:hypothetical protein